MADFNKDSSIYGSYILNPDQQPTFINIEL